MKFASYLTAFLGIVLFSACAARDTSIPVESVTSEGCPAILLSRTGGLGFESQSGIVAAVWPTGRIVRAESAAQPWQRHIVGHLAPADVAALMDLVQSASVRENSPGDAGVDMPDDILTLRRGSVVRQWAETPGFTSTPIVAEFRSRIFSFSIEQPARPAESFDELWACVTTRQGETR